ncbi:MAG: hypothetical protein QM655_16075 [Nocardioidaceae bacterium]
MLDADDDLDRVLRSALGPVSQTNDPAALARDAILAGTRRRHRVKAAALAGLAAVACAAIIVVPTWLANTHTPPTTPSPTISTPATSAWEKTAYDWAGELPTSTTPRLSYLSGPVLHTPTKTIKLPGTDAEVEGLTPFGVLMLLAHDPNDGDGFTSRYVLIDPVSGQVTTLPDVRGGTQNALVSPDGTQAAYGGAIVDLASHTVTARLPTTAVTLDSWTSEGIGYATAGNDYYLFKTDGTVTKLPAFPGVFAQGSSFGTRDIRGCSDITTLVDGSIQSSYHVCQGPGLMTVAPDGHTAIDHNFRVHLPATGKIELFDGAHSTFDTGPNTHFLWTSDNEVSFPVLNSSRSAAVIVTCSISELTCTRSPAKAKIKDGGIRLLS